MADIVLTSENGITAIVQPGVTTQMVVDGAFRGPQGLPGSPGGDGPQGPGVPLGGAAGQVLAKTSARDNDTAWETPTAGSITRTVHQVGHGFIAGQPVFFNGTQMQLSRANLPQFAEVEGIIASVIDVNDFVLCMGGYMSGLPGTYSVGPRYFLSPDTAGALTLNDPATRNPVILGQVSKPIFVADTPTSGYFMNYRGDTITGQGV